MAWCSLLFISIPKVILCKAYGLYIAFFLLDFEAFKRKECAILYQAYFLRRFGAFCIEIIGIRIPIHNILIKALSKACNLHGRLKLQLKSCKEIHVRWITQQSHLIV